MDCHHHSCIKEAWLSKVNTYMADACVFTILVLNYWLEGTFSSCLSMISRILVTVLPSKRVFRLRVKTVSISNRLKQMIRYLPPLNSPPQTYL